MRLTEFTNLKEMIAAFKTERACRDHYETIRWGSSTRACPHCGSVRHYTFRMKPGDRNRTYKCKDCKLKFNCLTGTVFENTKLPLLDWFKAIYVFTSHKKGISSVQLAKDLGVTQKTSWYMLHRLREMMRSKSLLMLTDHVEADETYVGGKEKNKHKSKRIEGTQGRSTKTKSAVLGLLERGGRVFVKHVSGTSSDVLQPIIDANVKEGSNLYTDEWWGYRNAKSRFTHKRVRHRVGEYVVESAHTNGIENFWSHLKRGIYGIYHQVSGKHLSRYCDEFAFRFNTRKLDEYERFNAALAQNDTRIPYRILAR